MRYKHLKEDLLAIFELQRAGRIDSMEAHELRSYVESLAAQA